MNEQAAKCRLMQGVVKWFDPAKGFGFIIPEDGSSDVLLHSNVLRNFGLSSVAEGARIELATQETERGMQAVQVISLEPPEPDGTALFEDNDLLDDDPDTALEPARVKWFDKAKGFGFANVFGRCEDVFIHAEVVRRAGFSELQPGEAISVKIAEGERGMLAVSVAAWLTFSQGIE